MSNEIDPAIKALNLAWYKMETGKRQEAEGRKLWIEGTLEIVTILHDARKRFSSDQAFGTWLANDGFDEECLTRHDRSALLNMALDLNVTREVLEQTHRRSWRHIWEEEIQPRLPHVGQPPEANGPVEAPDSAGAEKPQATTRRPKKAKGAKKPGNEEQENEWATDNRKWESEVVVTLNILKRLFAFRKRCSPEQWQRLVLDVEPSLGATVRSVSEEGLEVADALDDPLEQEADALTETGRVKTTPATRPSRPVHKGA